MYPPSAQEDGLVDLVMPLPAVRFYDSKILLIYSFLKNYKILLSKI